MSRIGSEPIPEQAEIALFEGGHRTTIVVVDIVESVRLMERDEFGVVVRWRELVRIVRAQTLPSMDGVLVKSLGDGLMLTFSDPRRAVSAALDMHRTMDKLNRDAQLAHPDAEPIRLRAGVHHGNVVADDIDIYGRSANLASRITALAGPGETVISAEVRDHLADGLDVRVEDLGECYLKHVDAPFRVFRVGNPGPAPILASRTEQVPSLRPAIAVIPFDTVVADDRSALVLGDAMADDIIAAFSKSPDLQVISRLSTAPYRGQAGNLESISRLLGAAYVLSGSCFVEGAGVTVRVQLCATATSLVLWEGHFSADVRDVFHGQDTIVPSVASEVGRAILKQEVARARSLPIPSMTAYTLYLGSIAMLHSLAYPDFTRARLVLEHLAYRYPRIAAPHALLAKWHMLCALQGWSDDPVKAGLHASAAARHALDLEPDNALALAMDGIVQAHFGKDLRVALDRCLAAVQANPQEPHAWLHLSATNVYLEDTHSVEEHAQRAIELSPLDPGRFGFEVFVGGGKLVVGKYDEAIAAAKASIRLNALHPASHRILTIGLAMSGRMDDARQAALGLMRADPGFRLGRYRKRYPGRDAPHARDHLRALEDAGVPE